MCDPCFELLSSSLQVMSSVMSCGSGMLTWPKVVRVMEFTSLCAAAKD